MPQMSELRLLLLTNEGEFELERMLLHRIVQPYLRQTCYESYNCELIVSLECKLYSSCLKAGRSTHGQTVPRLPAFHRISCGYLERLAGKLHMPCCTCELHIQGFYHHQGLIGERLKNKLLPDEIPSNVYNAFLMADELINTPAWNALKNAYTLDTQSNIYKLNRVDSETFAHLICESSDMAHNSVCLERCLEGLHQEDPLQAVEGLDHKDMLFDIFTYPHDTSGHKFDLDLHVQCQLLRQRVQTTLGNDNHGCFSLSENAMNQMTNISTKLTVNGDWSEEVALKLIKNVQDHMRQEEKMKVSVQTSPVSAVGYLAAFTRKALTLLKLCIDRLLCGERENLTRFSDADAHFHSLMYSSKISGARNSPYIIQPLHQGRSFTEWSEPSMLASRQREIDALSAYLSGASNNCPELLYGPPGCGKSSLLRWSVKYFQDDLERELNKSALEFQDDTKKTCSAIQPVVIACCCGTTMLAFNLQSMLVWLIEEIVKIYDPSKEIDKFKNVSNLCEYAEAVNLFQPTLALAKPANPLLIVIDDVERLCLETAEVFRWLPKTLPNQHVRIILTTASKRMRTGFLRRVGSGNCIDLSPCLDTDKLNSNGLFHMVKNKLAVNSKWTNESIQSFELSEKSLSLANEGLQRNESPLYVSLLADIIATLQTQQGEISGHNLPTSLADLFAVRLRQLQALWSRTNIFAYALLYFTIYLANARLGLSLRELIDLLSVDPLFECFCNWKATSEKFPVGCLINLLFSDYFGIGEYLRLVYTDERCLMAYSSEEFRKGVVNFWSRKMSLVDGEEEVTVTRDSDERPEISEVSELREQAIDRSCISVGRVHSRLITYWIDTTSQQQTGKAERSGAKSSDTVPKVDQISNQCAAYRTSYYFEAATPRTSGTGVITVLTRRFHLNARRLTELPYHLVQMGSEFVQEIYNQVAFCFDYLVGKLLQRQRLSDLFAELIYLRRVNEVRSCDELVYLGHALQRLSPKLAISPMLMSVELNGRIGHLIGDEYPLLGRTLISSIDRSACRVNNLSPLLLNCYSPVLRPEILSVFVADPGIPYLATLTPDCRFLFTLTPSEPKSTNANVKIVLWDANSLQKIGVFDLGRWPKYRFLAVHIPMLQGQKALISYTVVGSTMNIESGYLICDISDGEVTGKIELPTMNYTEAVCVGQAYAVIVSQRRIGTNSPESGMPTASTVCSIYALADGKPLGKKFTEIPQPCILLPNERHLVVSGKWLAKEAQDNSKMSSKTPYHKRPHFLQVRQITAPDKVTNWLNCKYIPEVMQCNLRGEYLYLGCQKHGQVFLFGIDQFGSKEASVIQPAINLNLMNQLKRHLGNETSGYSLENFPFDQDTISVWCNTPETIGVRRIWTTQDDRYVGVLYAVEGQIQFIGIWNINTRSLMALTKAFPGSEVRFTADMQNYNVVHFVSACCEHTWIETASLIVKETGKTLPTDGQSNQTNKLKKQISMLRFKGLDSPISDAYFVRGSNLVLFIEGQMYLTTLNNFERYVGGYLSNQTLSNVSTRFNTEQIDYIPQLNMVGAVDSKNHSLFAYFNLVTQKLVRINGPVQESGDILLGEGLLESFPREAYLTDDGDYLVLVYQQRTFATSNTEDSPISKVLESECGKPQLPEMNYFTKQNFGQTNVETKMSCAWNQKVVQVYHLNTYQCNPALKCQISLMGETILMLSGKYGLYTLRPDYANELGNHVVEGLGTKLPVNDTQSTRSKSKTILSRYSIAKGMFLGSTYLEPPIVSGSRFVNGGKFLLLCCGYNGHNLYLLSAPEYCSIAFKINVPKLIKLDEYTDTSAVNQVFGCDTTYTTVIIAYGNVERSKGYHTYATVNLGDSTLSPPQARMITMFKLRSRLMAVSSDGRLGVDAGLHLVNLTRGTVMACLDFSAVVSPLDISTDLLWAEFTSDGQYLLAALHNQQFGCPQLLVIANKAQRRYPLVGRALLPWMNIPEDESQEPFMKPRVKLIQDPRGRVLFISMNANCGKSTLAEFKLFLIREGHSRLQENAYRTATDRIRALLSTASDPKTSKGLNISSRAEEMDVLFSRLAVRIRGNKKDETEPKI